MVVRDLWSGADARWVGTETVRRGVRLRPGDRAVVVDAGRHQMTSFASLYSSAGTRPPRPGRGVAIRLADGTEVSVPRKHLELVPQHHPLVPEPDGTQAAWWLDQLDPRGMQGVPVSSLVPSSLPAVCQVLHPWSGSDADPMRWRTLAEQFGFASVSGLDGTREMFSIPAAADAGLYAATGELDLLTAGALVDVLTGATTTPNDVFVAVWEGWGDVPAHRFPGAAHLDTQGRGHFLLRGPLTGVLSSVSASGHERPAAGLWWPADRAWFVASEIDFEWTFVAGEGLIACLVTRGSMSRGRPSTLRRTAPPSRTDDALGTHHRFSANMSITPVRVTRCDRPRRDSSPAGARAEGSTPARMPTRGRSDGQRPHGLASAGSRTISTVVDVPASRVGSHADHEDCFTDHGAAGPLAFEGERCAGDAHGALCV